MDGDDLASRLEHHRRDESMHVEGIAHLFRAFCEEHPRIVNDEFKKHIYDMARTIVSLEDAFIELAFELGEVQGLTKDEVKQYIRYIADRRLTQLGLKPNFGVEKNPLPWLDFILNGPDHTNFFEGRVTEYEVGGLKGSWGYEEAFVPLHIVKKDGCPWCERLIRLLDQRLIEYDIVNASEQPSILAQFKAEGWTFPRVYHKGNLIGGATETAAYLGYMLPE